MLVLVTVNVNKSKCIEEIGELNEMLTDVEFSMSKASEEYGKVSSNNIKVKNHSS